MICKYKMCMFIENNGIVCFKPGYYSIDNFYENVTIDIDEETNTWVFEGTKREFEFSLGYEFYNLNEINKLFENKFEKCKLNGKVTKIWWTFNKFFSLSGWFLTRNKEHVRYEGTTPFIFYHC